jgi:hypothetical protein
MMKLHIPQQKNGHYANKDKKKLIVVNLVITLHVFLEIED